jgi:ubiquinone/menaquinone biosynthesis C-methylase UbiE
MTVARQEAEGSAELQGRLWGVRALDWAEIQERAHSTLYNEVIRPIMPVHGASLLDIGCGAGGFCALADRHGANVTGLDAAEGFIDVARQRMPRARFDVGEMEALPYPTGSFELVTAINALMFATDPVTAVREARRVAKSGATIVFAVWGDPDECDLSAILGAVQSFLPGAPQAKGPFALAQNGALEGLAKKAGLTPLEAREVPCSLEYRDLATAVRGFLSVGPMVLAIETLGEDRVRLALANAMSSFRKPDGTYRLENRSNHLISRA